MITGKLYTAKILIIPTINKKAMVIIATAIFLFGSAALRGYADEFHYENFRFGQRALGMGGAVTATWANPRPVSTILLAWPL